VQTDREPHRAGGGGKVEERRLLQGRLPAGEDHRTCDRAGTPDHIDDLVYVTEVLAALEVDVVAVETARGASPEKDSASRPSPPVDGAERDKSSEIDVHTITWQYRDAP